jgi:dihydrofolate reductase
MRKLILLMHASLDGFVAGPNGEMDWIKVDDELFEFVGHLTDQADTALYGRVTYQMMDSYWPTAGKKPNASKHDIQHAQWYQDVLKVVISSSMKGKSIARTQIVSGDILGQVQDLKQKPGKNILMLGSPTASHALMELGLIDEYRLFINPVILGEGIPLFKSIKARIALKRVDTKNFSSGVTGLHYEKVTRHK